MQSSKGHVTIWLSFSIILLSAGLVSHVLSIPAILDAAGRDSWLSVIAAAPLFLIFVVLMHVIMKRIRGQRLTDWIALQFGAWPAWLLRLSAAFLLFALGTHTTYETSFWAVTSYLQFTPMSLIVLVGVSIPAIAACMGIRAIATTSGILLPFVILLGYFVMAANTKYKDYSRLLPMLENGAGPVWGGMIYALAGMLEIWILMFYQHEVKRKFKLWHMLLLAVFMVSITLGPTMSAVTEFGPHEAVKQLSPPFEQWKLVNLGKLLQHVDFLSIYQWLCGAFARVAISIYLIVDLLEIRKPRKRYIAICLVTLAMSGIAMYGWRGDLVYQYVNRIQFPVMLVYVYSVTALLALLTIIRRKDKEVTTREGQPSNDGGPQNAAAGEEAAEPAGHTPARTDSSGGESGPGGGAARPADGDGGGDNAASKQGNPAGGNKPGASAKQSGGNARSGQTNAGRQGGQGTTT